MHRNLHLMRIAIIGSGISDLGAAYLLSRAHEVTVFERDSRAGVHTHTIAHQGLALDTGFPSLSALTRAMAGSSRLMVHEVDEIGPHYAETLRRWRANFHKRIPEVDALGCDERFERTWDFYLSFCVAAFRTRALRDVRLTLTRPFNEALA